MASFDKLLQDTVDVKVLTLEDYNRNQNTSIELDENQILLLGETKYEGITEIALKDQRYEITTLVTDAIFTHGKNRDAFQEVFMVAKDLDAAKRFIQQIGDSENGGSTKYILNINGNEEDCYNFVKDLRDSYDEIFEIRYGISDIYTDRAAGYSIYGGLLFMGAFFTILFLCTTVLIIYYKQISEGYDDKERFETLQKVGMDDLEVKRTINKQILIVFFLPLIGALLHLTMASNMIIKMLEIFWLHDTKITILCMVTSCAIFTAAYIFVYRLTAKTYYNIVKW
jgi:putative ABC transport system permease protein